MIGLIERSDEPEASAPWLHWLELLRQSGPPGVEQGAQKSVTCRVGLGGPVLAVDITHRKYHSVRAGPVSVARLDTTIADAGE